MSALGLTAVEPKENLTLAYNHELRLDLGKTSSEHGGCASWYLDDLGATPRSGQRLRPILQMAQFDASAYNPHRQQRSGNPLA
ncbi:MAG: hypothetical protein R2693_07345 [Nocardioidaceae bacterium]